MIYMNAIYFSVDKSELTKTPMMINEAVEKIMEILKTNPDLSFRNKMTISMENSFETNNMVVSLVFH